MADSLCTLSGPRGTLVFKETAATSTLEQNVLGKAANAGGTIYAMRVSATSNTGEDVYLAIYENSSATAAQLTVGTHHPVTVVKCAAGSIVEVLVPCGIATSANSNYFHACVKQSAGTAGNTSPSGTVSFTIIGE